MPSFFTREPGSPRNTALVRRLILSYAPDWVLTIVLAAVFFSLNVVSGFRRSFSLTDTSLLHTFATKERVPDSALYLIAFVAPLVLQPLMNLITIRSWWDLHNGTLGLILSLAIAGSITQFTKITVGRPRPDIIARCIPIPGSHDPVYGLSTAAICTQTDEAIMRDGFRSFPSGHSSLSFAGLGFFSFYLAGKLHLFDKRGYTGKAWLSLTPLAAASLVAISRTMDYRHHWHDVVAGSLLGFIVSYFCYRQYYPSIGSTLSHRPYSPDIRFEVKEILPTHHRTPSHDRPHTVAERVEPYRDDNIGADQDLELGGTVRRAEPEPLEEVWRKGQGVVSDEHGTDNEVTR